MRNSLYFSLAKTTFIRFLKVNFLQQKSLVAILRCKNLKWKVLNLVDAAQVKAIVYAFFFFNLYQLHFQLEGL